MDKMMTSSERANQTLDKHVSDCTDSDNEEKEDGELEEGEVEEEFDENPQQKDDAKENNRDTNSTNHNTSLEQDNVPDVNNHLNLGSQKFRGRRDYHHHPAHARLNNVQDKRNKHDLRRKRRHSGDERDERNRKQNKRGRFRGGPLPDLSEDVDDDEMMEQHWPPRGQIRGQRKQQQSDINSNENCDLMNSIDQSSSLNIVNEQKIEQLINNDTSLLSSSSPINENHDDENMNADEKQSDRINRQRTTRNPQQQIENRSRRYYDGNMTNNSNNRRTNDRDRSTWQDRTTNNSSGPPLCKFFVENRCMKGNDCLFSHDYKPLKKMEVCKYYVQNKGYCQKNELCPFLHGEFPCKFFHTGTKDCMQGDRCKFSHDPIANNDIVMAFERFLNDSDDINRPNRVNPNVHHPNSNSSTVNFDVIGAAVNLPAPATMPTGLSDPSNFPMIPNLMDLLLMQNNQLQSSTNSETLTTTTTTTTTTAINNTTQSSPPMQRSNLFNDTLKIEKNDNDESINNKTVPIINSASPSSTSTSTTDNNSSNTISTNNSTTTNANCPLPLPPTTMNNSTLNLPSPFGHLPPPNLTRQPSTILPPPPPNLFPMNALGTGRMPMLFPPNNGLPLPPPGALLDVKLLAQAAAFAAVANKFSTPTHHASQSSSPQLGRDIDERDRQSSTTIRGDIDERPSDVFNRLTSTSTSTLLQTTNNINNSISTSPTMTINDEQLKTKTIQDIFRSTRLTSIDPLSNSTSVNSTAGPSFDFISMLEQLKQPRQMQTNENFQDSLEIRSSPNQSFIYILRPVICSFKPYPLPNNPTDPRLHKYQEKIHLWSEQERLERFKTPILSSNNNNNHHYSSLPLRTQQMQTSNIINDTNSSRDPRLLRNSVSNNRIGVSIISPANPFVRPNDNLL